MVLFYFFAKLSLFLQSSKKAFKLSLFTKNGQSQVSSANLVNKLRKDL